MQRILSKEAEMNENEEYSADESPSLFFENRTNGKSLSWTQSVKSEEI